MVWKHFNYAKRRNAILILHGDNAPEDEGTEPVMLGSGAVLHHPIVVDINSVVGDDSVMMSEQKDIDSDKNVTAIDDDPIYVGGSVDNLQCNSVVEDSAPNGNVNAKTDDDYR